MSDNTRKVSIWMTDQMMELKQTPPDLRSFSRRVGDTIERYDILLKLEGDPEMSGQEKVTLGEALLGGYMDKNKIKYLHENIADTEMDGSAEFSKRVESWSYTKRMAAIESLGI